MRRAGILVLAAGAVLAQPAARFVAFDVSATAGDLRAGEIEVTDNRTPQAVIYWRSNQRTAAPRVTVVVYNLAEGPIQSMAWNRTVSAMRPLEGSDLLYFYLLTPNGALVPVHELPKADAETVPVREAWMNRLIPQFETMWSVFPSKADSRSTNFGPYLGLAARLAAFPGRKTLVCVGCLFASPRYWDPATASGKRAFGLQVPQLATALQQARTAVYLIGGRATSTTVGDNIGPLAPDQVGAFADLTGGRVYSAGQIEEAMAQAARDAQWSYRAMYLPAAGSRDGKRHKIAVRCTRPGVHMLAPRCYVAAPVDDREQRPPIPDTAIASAFEQRDLGLEVSRGLPVEMQVPVDDLLLLPRNGRYVGSVTMRAICYAADGHRMACTEVRRVRLDLSEQERTSKLRLQLDVPGEAARGKMRVIVCDDNSGACGSQTLEER